MTRVSLHEAQTNLEELAQRAEAGEEIVITRDGRDAVRMVQATPKLSEQEIARRMSVLEEAQRLAAETVIPGPCAARSQDFLYDENGLPA